MLSAVLQMPCIFENLVKNGTNDQMKEKNVVWRRKGWNHDKNMDNGNRY